MQKILSIEIDNKCIKIIEALKKSNGQLLSIIKFLSLNIPADCIIEGKIVNLDFVRAKIENALLDYKIKTNRVIFVISPNLVITRKIKLPILKKESHNISMIKLEFERLLSTNDKQIVIYKISDTIKNVNNRLIDENRYIVNGLSYNTYNQYIELSKMLRLHPVAIVTTSNCLEKISSKHLIINKNTNYRGTVAFVRILCDAIVFCVVKDGINDFSRIIGLNAHKSKLYKSYKVAELSDSTYSCSNNLYYKDDYCVNMCIDEINKNIRYYSSMDKGNDIDKIYLYTDCKERNIDIFEESLSSTIEKDVEVIKEVTNLDLENYQNGFDVIKYFHGFLSLYANIDDINFLNDKIKKDRTTYIMFFFIISAVLCLIIMVIFYSRNNIIKNELLKDEINSMNLFINNKENIKINNRVEKIKNEVNFLKRYKDQVFQLKEVICIESSVSSEILRAIKEVIPVATDVDSIIIGRNNIQMQCESCNIEEIILFLGNLRGVNYISSVYIPFIKYNGSGDKNYYYSIICKLGDVGCNENK